MKNNRTYLGKHCYGISLREVAALTEALEELAADSELESEVVFLSATRTIRRI